MIHVFQLSPRDMVYTIYEYKMSLDTVTLEKIYIFECRQDVTSMSFSKTFKVVGCMSEVYQNVGRTVRDLKTCIDD